MGPRLFRRGDWPVADVRLRRGIGGFNGATPFQAWRRGGRDPHRDRQPGFNGATPFQAWRPLRAGGLQRAVWIASMGPRLFRRGDDVLTDEIKARDDASMGPRLFRRGDIT